MKLSFTATPLLVPAKEDTKKPRKDANRHEGKPIRRSLYSCPLVSIRGSCFPISLFNFSRHFAYFADPILFRSPRGLAAFPLSFLASRYSQSFPQSYSSSISSSVTYLPHQCTREPCGFPFTRTAYLRKHQIKAVAPDRFQTLHISLDKRALLVAFIRSERKALRRPA